MSSAHRPEAPADLQGVAIAPGVVIAERLLRWSFSRSGGPGGQNVNKVSTKAELRVDLESLPISRRAVGRLRGLAAGRIIGEESVVDEEGRLQVRGGELVLTSESERSQVRNKDECLAKLRELLLAALVEPKVRRKTKPSKASKQRRLDAKKQRGQIKRGRSRPEH